NVEILPGESRYRPFLRGRVRPCRLPGEASREDRNPPYQGSEEEPGRKYAIWRGRYPDQAGPAIDEGEKVQDPGQHRVRVQEPRSGRRSQKVLRVLQTGAGIERDQGGIYYRPDGRRSSSPSRR